VKDLIKILLIPIREELPKTKELQEIILDLFMLNMLKLKIECGSLKKELEV